MFGLYLALFGRQRRTGAVIAAVAFGYFLLMSSVVIPAMGEGRYVVESYFDDLGGNKLEILLSPFLRPAVIWGKISSPTTFYFAAALTAPLLFVPLRKPSVLFIGSLTFVFIALWDNPMAKSICFQYQAGLLPVVFWAFAGVLTGEPTPGLLQNRRAVLWGTVFAGVVLSIFLGNTFWSKPNLSVRPVPGRLDLVQRISANIN